MGQVKVAPGVFKTADTRIPTLRPKFTAKNCRYCDNRQGCPKQFFVEDQQSDVCHKYQDMMSPKEVERLKELAKIMRPAPRQEGERKDCLHCGKLARPGKHCLPKQGTGSVCADYYEALPRKPDDPANCLHCFNNWGCLRQRVLHGEICELYGDYAFPQT